jgi:hypothetical protein
MSVEVPDWIIELYIFSVEIGSTEVSLPPCIKRRDLLVCQAETLLLLSAVMTDENFADVLNPDRKSGVIRPLMEVVS